MRPERETRQPSRVVIGHCPACKLVVLVENEYEVWPIVSCRCGWQGATTKIDHHTRFERRGYVQDEFRPDVVA